MNISSTALNSRYFPATGDDNASSLGKSSPSSGGLYCVDHYSLLDIRIFACTQPHIPPSSSPSRACISIFLPNINMVCSTVLIFASTLLSPRSAAVPLLANIALALVRSRPVNVKHLFMTLPLPRKSVISMPTHCISGILHAISCARLLEPTW